MIPLYSSPDFAYGSLGHWVNSKGPRPGRHTRRGGFSFYMICARSVVDTVASTSIGMVVLSVRLARSCNLLYPVLWLAQSKCSIPWDGSLLDAVLSVFLARSRDMLNPLAWLAQPSCSILLIGSLSENVLSSVVARSTTLFDLVLWLAHY